MMATARLSLHEKGAALSGMIERVAPAVYAVPSLTTPGDFHLVTDLERLGVGTGLRCDCRAAEVGQACSHREALVRRRQLEARKTKRSPR